MFPRGESAVGLGGRGRARGIGRVLPAVGLLLTTTVAAIVGPAAVAAATPTYRPGDTAVFLPSDNVVLPRDKDDREIKEQGVILLRLPLTLHAGETRIVTSQLGVTMTDQDGSDDGAEVDHHIRCLDSEGRQVGVAHYQGTNHQGPSHGELDLHGSLLSRRRQPDSMSASS